MDGMPSFLESALNTLQFMVEKWDLLSSQLSNEQLRNLQHGCELVEETFREVETSEHAADSTPPEQDRISRLRGQRIFYDDLTARSDQRRKRRRTVDRPSAQLQDKEAMLRSPDSIEDNRGPGQGSLQDTGPGIHELSPLEMVFIPSPATSAVPDGHTTEPETLFIPEDTDRCDIGHQAYDFEEEMQLGIDPTEGTNLFNTREDPCGASTSPFHDVQGSPAVPNGALHQEDGAHDAVQQAFNDFINDALSHPFSNELTAFLRNDLPELSTEEQYIRRIGARFQDLISRREFWLPHEDHRNPSAIVTENQILGPLLHKDPMTPELLHGVLYRVLPDVFDIIEHGSYPELREDLCRLTSPGCESSVVVVSEAKPEIVVFDICKRQLTYVTTREMSDMNGTINVPADWKVQLYNPILIDSSIEYTLLSVFLVEAECNGIHPTPPYVDSCLRKRYFEALLAREAQQSKVCNDESRIETESIAIRPARVSFVVSSPLTNSRADFHIDDFDQTLLSEALSGRPKHMKDMRCLRILQYIHATGSPQVLDLLKAAAMSLEDQVDLPVYDLREAHAARITAIHKALDSRGYTSHLGIVQSRFARLCYYREFQSAVESLRRSHRARRTERQRLWRRQQQLEQVAESDRLAVAPQTIAMAEQFSETTGKSSSVVRDDIVRRLSVVYKRSSSEDQAQIKTQVDSYIRQGKILHLLLQGCSCDTSPAVLLLIPTLAVPPLDITSCELDEETRLKLRKPFKPSEYIFSERDDLSQLLIIYRIDHLSETEAQWMGEALRILRPEILAKPPGNALKLLRDEPTVIEALDRRESKQFAKDPLGLFA